MQGLVARGPHAGARHTTRNNVCGTASYTWMFITS
jgi:hypothetical protein